MIARVISWHNQIASWNKDPEIEQLADELALRTHTSKTEVIRQALIEKRERLQTAAPHVNREESLREFMETRIWPGLPAAASRRWTRNEEEAALGYGIE